MSLIDRVVYTNISSIRGYVRKVNDHKYMWTLKDWEPEGPERKDVSPFIMSYGYADKPREAFQDLYREISYYTLNVVNDSDYEGED